MKQLSLAILTSLVAAASALAGTEYTGKEMRQTPAVPEECWYGDTEWNVNLWGTYAFTGTEMNSLGHFLSGERSDTYLQTDHAWGGGIDAKYFWHKYFGFGVEGFVLDAKRTEYDFTGLPAPGAFVLTRNNEDRRAIGSVLGTFTLRYPIGCSRFAPYGIAGGGVIFGGGERDRIVSTTTGAGPIFVTQHEDNDGKAIGQFGGGVEVRITRHIGWTNDFSWNVVDGGHNNFGMVRSGLNFAF